MSENWKFIPHREVNASLALGLKIVFAALLFFFGAANANASTINRPPNYISLKSGLVGHWTFDGKDLNTGAAMDASGQGNHGALVNMSTSTSRVPGKFGQALKFDGTNDYVDAGNGNSLNVADSAVTICTWAKTLSWKSGGSWIVGKGTDNGNVNEWDYAIYYYSDGDIAFGTGD